MSLNSGNINRRKFLWQIGAGVSAIGAFCTKSISTNTHQRSRHALVLADAHIGLIADSLDGAEWLSRAFSDIRENVLPIDYAVFLGDMVHKGTNKLLDLYIKLRNQSKIVKWFELAGNHDYGINGLKNYNALIRSSKPYSFIDGNIVWFFLSDEAPDVPGYISDATCQWLKESIVHHQDKIIIVCSHQLVYDTVFASLITSRYIHPKEKLGDILSESTVDLWLCGHAHFKPYSQEAIVRKSGTTFINVASLSHAYGTKESQSFILEFKNNEKKIKARRRVHDNKSFSDKLEVEIPLRSKINFNNSLTNKDQIIGNPSNN